MREIRPSGSMRGRRGHGVVVAANHPRLPTLRAVLGEKVQFSSRFGMRRVVVGDIEGIKPRNLTGEDEVEVVVTKIRASSFQQFHREINCTR